MPESTRPTGITLVAHPARFFTAKGEGRLTPDALRDLRSGYEEQAAPVREAEAPPLRPRQRRLRPHPGGD